LSVQDINTNRRRRRRRRRRRSQCWPPKHKLLTRSQAVARIADRTASQYLLGSRDVIGHVTIW